MPDLLDLFGRLFEHLVELVGYVMAWPIHQFSPF